MADPVTTVQAFFARHEAVHLLLPDGWVGRPYDNQYGLASVSEAGGTLTIELDTGDVVEAASDPQVVDAGTSLLVHDVDRATFASASGSVRAADGGVIELVALGSRCLTDDERREALAP